VEAAKAGACRLLIWVSNVTDHAIHGLFNELEKIGGAVDLLLRGATGVAGQAVKHPGAAYWRTQQQKKGLSKHQQTMLALKHGYPAGWVGMNIRPR